MALDAEPGPDDPSSDEAAAEPASEADHAAAADPEPDDAADDTDAEMPVFHRMWSSPVPPDGD